MTELSKQDICIGERALPVFSQAYCEGDIIVPDSKPDMAQILQTSANVVVSGKRCGADRISVDGHCDITVLYLSEHGSICAVNTVQTFSHTADAKGVTEDMEAEVEAQLQSADCSIINSRKMNIKMLIAIDANACCPVNAQLCTGIESDSELHTLKKTVRPYKKVHRSCEQMSIKERLDLPAGKPDIDTILKTSMRFTVTETKPIADKVVVNGTAYFTVLYLESSDSTKIQTAEYELPFSEVIEAPGADEGMNVNARVRCEQLYVQPACDSDGDNRKFEIECTAQIFCKVFCETELEVVEDAYCTDCIMNANKSAASIDRLAACNKMQITLKDTIELPSDIGEVYGLCARPDIASTVIEGGKVNVEGIMEVEVLYSPADCTPPIASFKHIHKFSQVVDCDGIDQSMMCDVNISVEHINYSIVTSNELEFRIIASLDTRIISKSNVSYVSEIETEELPENENMCCIKIYFVRPGDRLWDIAKRYRSTPERIIAENELGGESDICPGKKLIIM